MKTTKQEQGWLAIMRLNQILPKKEITWRKQIGRLSIKFHWASSSNLWGRFGGGWNWELGFQASQSTLILNLLICSLRFDIKEKSK